MKETKIRLDYEVYKWGPLLIKTKIPEQIRLKLLSEAKASTLNFESELAGIIKKQIGFRDIKMFLPFFNTIFEM